MKTFFTELKVCLKPFFCIFMAFALVGSASALSDAELDYMNTIGAYYYNPTGMNSSCFSSDISIAGSTAAQKIWSGLRSFLTPEQAAGALGNMANEGGFNPVRHEISKKNSLWPGFDILNDASESYGIGLIQWSWGRRVDLLHYIQSNDPSLMQYFMDPDTYSTYGSGGKTSGDIFLEKVGEAVFDRLIQLELEVLRDEITNKSAYKPFLETTTVREASDFFLRVIEAPANPDYDLRGQHSQNYYDAFSGMTMEPSGSDGTNVTGSNITIIGDSITEGSKSQILEKLPSADINSEVGRQFSAGIEIAKSMELRNVLVFALGTNSASLTSTQIQEVIDLAGPSRAIYFITNYGTFDYTNNNNLLKQAADNNSNVYLINWATSVSNDPTKYISSDGVHPTTDGRKLFADLIYNAVTSSNLTSDGCSVSGEFQQIILEYAWPEYHPGKYIEMMPAYAAAVQRRRAEGKFVGGGNYPGIDCGGFVSAVLDASGIASNYPGGTITQEKWVIANGWTLLNETDTTPIDTAVLQPGDVAFSNGAPGNSAHTFIYVGEIPGFKSKIASASYGGSNINSTYWRAPMAGGEDLVNSDPGMGGYPVRWYRKG